MKRGGRAALGKQAADWAWQGKYPAVHTEERVGFGLNPHELPSCHPLLSLLAPGVKSEFKLSLLEELVGIIDVRGGK